MDSFAFFFERVHPIFPIANVSSSIPTTHTEIAAFAVQEPHLTAAILCVASGFVEGGMDMHLGIWRYFLVSISLKRETGQTDSIGNRRCIAPCLPATGLTSAQSKRCYSWSVGYQLLLYDFID